MASTRRPPSQQLPIYDEAAMFQSFANAIHDEQIYHDHLTSPLGVAPSLPSQMNVFAQVKGTVGGIPSAGGYSPLKHPQPSSSPPRRLYADTRSNINLPPPNEAELYTDSITKKPHTLSYEKMAGRPMRNLYASFPTLISNRDNMAYSDNIAEFPASDSHNLISDSMLGQPQLPVPLPAQEEISTIYIPEPCDMPVIEDEGGKPGYSYAQLIAMAILRAPGRRLTLNKIYEWITNTFEFYRATEDPNGKGWQNSIRHNLSLNKSFQKIERPKNDPGKGNYWGILPGHEEVFLREKNSRRPASSAGIPKFAPQSGKDCLSSSATFLMSQADVKREEPQSVTAAVPVAEEPSSDATIPASDPALFEDAMPPPALPHQFSSPLHTLQSSPPVSNQNVCDLSPALGIDIPSSQIARSKKKRNFSTMNDSGYFSSLESSAARPYSTAPLDPAAPRFKRGRAEEELARIRSSSHDISSPHKGHMSRGSMPHTLSSSPSHYDGELLAGLGAPITPAIIFKKPRKPPPSVSPNTHLQDHRNRMRDMIGSPLKYSDFGDSLAYSPAFRLHEDDFSFQENPFSVWTESPLRTKTGLSPTKQSAKRPHLGRAASALADITGTSQKLNPTLTRPTLGSPIRKMSPNKSPTKGNFVMPNDFNNDKLLDLEYLLGTENDDLGMDLLGGFTKIGEKENQSPIRATKTSSRPGLGARSNTTRY